MVEVWNSDLGCGGIFLHCVEAKVMIYNEKGVGMEKGSLRQSKVFLHSHYLNYINENYQHRGITGKKLLHWKVFKYFFCFLREQTIEKQNLFTWK